MMGSEYFTEGYIVRVMPHNVQGIHSFACELEMAIPFVVIQHERSLNFQ